MATQIVKRLRDLSKYEENREVLIQSQSNTTALVVFLGNTDQEVRELAIEALFYLSESEHLRRTLSSIAGLPDGVKKLMFSKIDRIRHFAVETYKNIQVFLGNNSSAGASNFSSHIGIKEGSEIVIDVDGAASEEDRRDIQRALLSIKGIVSFQIDLENDRVIVRSTVESNIILDAIESQTPFLASLSVKKTPQRGRNVWTWLSHRWWRERKWRSRWLLGNF